MTLRPALIVAACAAAFAAVPAAAQDRSKAVETALFDICPKVFSGKLSLTDAAQVAAIGYRTTPPRITPAGPAPRIETGEGADRIVIASSSTKDPGCMVWFSQDGQKKLLQTVIADAGDAGFKVGLPTKLGDGTSLIAAKRAGSPATMVIIFADAGGELGNIAGSTTIIFMN